MKISEVTALVAEIEAGSVQVNIAQLTEVVNIISDLVYGTPGVLDALVEHGQQREIKSKFPGPRNK
jgi:hypothetical protein